MDPLQILAREGALAVLLFVNMVYLGRKIDNLTSAIYKSGRARKKAK